MKLGNDPCVAINAIKPADATLSQGRRAVALTHQRLQPYADVRCCVCERECGLSMTMLLYIILCVIGYCFMLV